MKNQISTENNIKYNSLVTIKEGITKRKVSFYEKGHEDYEIKLSNSQKNSYPFFIIEESGSEKRIAFKIKDINKYINRFYIVKKLFIYFNFISFFKIME